MGRAAEVVAPSSSLRTDGGYPVAQVNDLSRSLTAFDLISTLVVVVELSKASWLVSGAVPGVEREPLIHAWHGSEGGKHRISLGGPASVRRATGNRMTDTRESTAASLEAIYAKIARFAAETNPIDFNAADRVTPLVRPM
jgi:hypothetical protein